MRSGTNRSVYSGFEKAMTTKDIRKAVQVLREGKGVSVILRNLNYLISRCETPEDVRFVIENIKSDNVIIQDRTIFEGVYVFVANNYEQGNLSKRDFETYMRLFNLMMSMVKAPDLMIYLKSSVPHLVAQIHKRGREYEQGMNLSYLQGLNEKYEKFINEDYKGHVLTIDVDGLDFESRPEDFAMITERIDSELFSLFGQTNNIQGLCI